MIEDIINMEKIDCREFILSQVFYEKTAELAGVAGQIHADVNQKYDDKPYIYHLLLVKDFTVKYLPYVCDEVDDVIPIIFGALFHDTIEDARLTYNDVRIIAENYMTDGQAYRAAEIVYALTNEKGRNRHERANDKYYQGIRECKYAPLVKAADRLANYSYAKSVHSKMEKCYQREMKEFVKDALTSESGEYLVPLDMVNELFS